MCNLASIALPRFVRADKTFDFQKLYEVTKVCIYCWLGGGANYLLYDINTGDNL